MTDYVLETDRLRLRRPQESDVSAIYQQVNDYDIARSTLNIPYPYVPADATAFLQHVHKVWTEKSRYPFAITLKEVMNLWVLLGWEYNIVIIGGEAGYWIGKSYWGCGYMTEALKRIIQFGFEELELNRIQASHFTDNPASGRVMEKAGMRYEGILRQYVRKWDAYKDLRYMAILRDEYGG